MTIYKPLVYVTLTESTQWDLKNLTRVMLISDHPWDPVSANDELEVNVIFPNRYGVGDELYEYLLQIKYSEIHLDHQYSYI